MGVKERKTYNLDSGVVEKFEKICKKKGLSYSGQMEMILEHFVAKDDERFVDEIQAPRIEALVERALNKHTNRMAAMIHNSHVDSKAVLIGLPTIYKKMIGVMEASIRLHMEDELLADVETTLQSKYGSEALAMRMMGEWRTVAKEMVIEESKQGRKQKDAM
ncbi:hypothetical protein ABKP09_24785 [Peribacillus frigoritolerans]|uniref:hypothetical protein n=1 Tax=Peribacillus frigoritolerans TaxID=450367 RepID=UPI0032B4B408